MSINMQLGFKQQHTIIVKLFGQINSVVSSIVFSEFSTNI